jgi:hypothetical protein
MQVLILKQGLSRVSHNIQLPNLKILHLTSFLQVFKVLSKLFDLTYQLFIYGIFGKNFLLESMVPFFKLAVNLLLVKKLLLELFRQSFNFIIFVIKLHSQNLNLFIFLIQLLVQLFLHQIYVFLFACLLFQFGLAGLI